MSLLRIRVPASSANLGSGFDTVGLSLTLYNVFDVDELLPSGRYEVEIIGEGSGDLGRSKRNLFLDCYESACREWGFTPPGLRLRCLNVIPLCRGLGSSSSAVVGGVALANALRDRPLPLDELLALMVRMEGHPDNVVPSCIGGMVVSCWDGKDLRYVRMPRLPASMIAVVAVPAVEVSTADARKALPEQVSLKDAVYNLSRSALLAASWATGNWKHLPWAMEDRLHQPFRAKLFPGGEEILQEVRNVPGCTGVAISGSAPSVIAFSSHMPEDVARHMCAVFTRNGVRSRFFMLSEDRHGVTVQKNISGAGFYHPLRTGGMRRMVFPAGSRVTSVHNDRGVVKIAVLGVPDVPGVASRLFTELADSGVATDMIVQSVMRGQVNDIAFLVRSKDLSAAIDITRRFAGEIEAQGVTYDTEIAKVTVSGEQFGEGTAIASRMFSVLADKGINIDMIGASSRDVTCVVASGDAEGAVCSLSDFFIGPNEE